MNDDEVISRAFSPLLAWAQETGRIHGSEVPSIMAAAARDPYAAEAEVRGRKRGLVVPSALELPEPPSVAYKVAAGPMVSASSRVSAAAAIDSGFEPDSMGALLAEAAAADVPGRPPSLFPEGDLPSFTASGIAASQLLRVPWQARPAVARASAADAYALLSSYAGPDGAAMAEWDAMPGGPLHDDVSEYSRAYERWAGGFGG